ncbi:methylenetetrahydrofolate reductase [NAD(P)H] [Ghiorsea bivora]|uniref:methylenetetrahydrofolate reductase [NAD(P)H] n=1 Tax=Ghiorsea bivora TaxID=1485545 RepID=UPI00056E2FE9|nr:methylenetetrahydrofolate reductase [NAD(P)H] [Ghiorsea bivora]
MLLADILAAKKKAGEPSISFEFFPPKTDQGEQNLWQCIQELTPLNPAFVSVTYGAGGTTQDRTLRIVERIKKETTLEPMAHLTCVGSTQADLAALLNQYKAAGMKNILALRGDAPEGQDSFQAVQGGFAYATDLVKFVREQQAFSIAVATYPEGHPESKGGVADDLKYLKMKQDEGAIAAITQYFFDNDHYYRFCEQAEKLGITIPIIPGIMPIANYEQIVRFSAMCGASIPDWVHTQMSPIKDDLGAVKEMGIEIATKQCQDLLANDVAGLHIYALNKSEASLAIYRNL